MVCGFGGVHSLDELSVVRCSLVFVRTGILKRVGVEPLRVPGDISACSRHAPGLASMRMDLDPTCIGAANPVDGGFKARSTASGSEQSNFAVECADRSDINQRDEP